MDITGFFQGFVALIWGIAVLLGIVVVVRVSRNQPVRGGGIAVLVVVLIAVLLSSVSAGVVFINPEERGVVISALSPTGYRDTILQPGLRWVIPFFEHVERYPISRMTYTMSISQNEGKVQGDDSIYTRTSDGQEIKVDASVIYSVDPTKIIQLHINWKGRYEDDLVRPLARGVIRDAVSQFRVDEVLSTKRAEMSNMVRDRLTEKFSENGIILVDYLLRNIEFSKEYSASVEQKQIAEQQAQQAKFVVESKKQEAEQARQTAQGQADAVVIRSKAEGESKVIQAKADAEARLIQAKAEAEALSMISKALSENPNLLNYQYISKLAPTVQTMLLPSNSQFILPYPGSQAGVQPTSPAPATTK